MLAVHAATDRVTVVSTDLVGLGDAARHTSLTLQEVTAARNNGRLDRAAAKREETREGSRETSYSRSFL
jgi:hypothetical protein